ncbi:tetratricopeptide repeat protein [Dolichospermum sp. FACHB-1091]|uniref:tetratricopeptide repeat protein n=1 Tax=Dolichospermum sp. FACHB-1091 TaxID=2692798 RepID=UPI0032206420
MTVTLSVNPGLSQEIPIDDYNPAIKINPNDANAYYNRGVVRYELGDKQGAIKDFNQAIKINPNFPQAYGNRGNVRAPTPSNIKSLSFSSPRSPGIEGGARRGQMKYLIRAETPVAVVLYGKGEQ